MACFLFFILWIIRKQFGVIDIIQKAKLMVSPALKGVLYSMLTAGIFVLLMHLIAFFTNFSGIFATFDADYTGEELTANNVGRYGLTLFLTGIFIIMSGIKQGFKVNE
jgi:archaellum biogenesis protein FlaJ (TadC family)